MILCDPEGRDESEVVLESWNDVEQRVEVGGGT